MKKSTKMVAVKKERKPRSDMGRKRGPSIKSIAKETVKQGILTKREAFDTGRKERSDKGKKRGPSIHAIARESVKQGLVSHKEAFGRRKERSDKGKKRGARKVKEAESEVEEFYYA